MMTFWKNIILFGIKSALILKKNLIANLFEIKKKEIEKKKTYSDETTEFHDKEMTKVGSDYICPAVINVNSALKKDRDYYPQLFLKQHKYIRSVNLELFKHFAP